MVTNLTSRILSDSNCYLGFDIGSVSINTVIMDDYHNILEEYYDYVHGKPFNVLKERLTFSFNFFEFYVPFHKRLKTERMEFVESIRFFFIYY